MSTRKKRFVLLGLVVPCALVAAVWFAWSLARHTENKEPSSDGPIVISLGVYEDGMGFLEWEEPLKYSTNVTGTIDFRCRVRGTFTRRGSGRGVTCDLALTVDDEGAFRVDGQYAADVPFHLVLLGAAEGESEDVTYRCAPGKGGVHHAGPSPLVYKRPE